MVDQTWFARNLHLYRILINFSMGGIYRGFPWLPTGISMVFWGVDRHTVWEGNSKCHGRCRTPNHCLGLKHFKLINACVLSWWHCDHLLYLCMCVRMSVCVCVCAWVSVNSCDFSLRVGVFVCDVFSNMSLYTNKFPINVNATFAPHNSESPPSTRIPSVKWQKVRGCLQIKFQKHIVLSPHCWTRRRLATN